MPIGPDRYRGGLPRADRSGPYVEAGTHGQDMPEPPADRPISEIAGEIRGDWAKINYGAVPYLDAMDQLGGIDDKFYMDSADSVVNYFLSNASSWRGDTAKRVKSELKGMVKRRQSEAKYVEEGTEGMWEGVGQVVSGAANIAFDPLVIAGAVGYQVGKKGLLDKIGRGKKGPPDDRRLPPDNDPFRD